MTAKLLLAATAWLLVPAATAADLVFLDGFDDEPVCSAGGLGAQLLPLDAATVQLGQSARFALRLRSCGYAGTVQLTPQNLPSGWSVVFDPATPLIDPTAYALVSVTVAVASDGAAGVHDVTVLADGGGNTATAASPLGVNDLYVITLLAGTGAGSHAFPPQLSLRVGTLLRFANADTVAHRIHTSSTIAGVPHEASDMPPGGTYDVTPTAMGYDGLIYCHDHGTGTGVMQLTVHN